MATTKRTSDEIRKSIDTNREGLSTALTQLRGGVTELTDWRKQARTHKKELIVGTAVLGVAIGIGIALTSFFKSD
jgi:F0F1-type ATP synthase membrane subunit c/vacuolar-type H+-ATPase subunit K